IHTPKAVFHMTQERKPGRAAVICRRMVMRGENPADDVFINRYGERQRDLFGDARTSPPGITPLHFNNSANEIWFRAFSGLHVVFWGKQQSVFAMNQSAMETQ